MVQLAEENILDSKERIANWGKKEWDNIKDQGELIYKQLAESINKELSPESNEVQIIIQRHYQMIECFYQPSKEVYIGLTQLYSEHPDFRKFFNAYHPTMIEFIGKAMTHYANKNL